VNLVDSGTFFRVGKAKVWTRMICREKSFKHIAGQSSNAITFSQVERKLTLVSG
jgi:hypothetical protein